MMRAPAVWLIPLALGVGACATKSDVDRVRDDLALVRMRQDSLTAAMRELERRIVTELEEQRTLAVTSGGDVRRQLDDMERQLVQIQELLGQSQIVLQGLRERSESREREVALPPAGQVEGRDTTTAEPGGQPGASDEGARGLYAAAIEQFRRGAYLTARTGFEEFLAAYPAHELAPDAQFHIAETFRAEDDNGRAIREYNRVVELYPNSQAAPRALYKAGLSQVEQGNRDLACQYFQRVLAGFPRSDEARLARDQAERLSCR